VAVRQAAANIPVSAAATMAATDSGYEVGAEPNILEPDAGLMDGDDDDDYSPTFFPDGEPEEAAPGLNVSADAESLVRQSTHTNGTFTTYGDVATVDARVHRSKVAKSARELKNAVATASEAAEVALRQERMEGDRLMALRHVVGTAEAELEHLQAIGEAKPNIALQQASAKRLSDALASEQAQADVMNEAVEAARKAEDERDALLLEYTHKRREHEGHIHATEVDAAANRMAAPRRAAKERRAAERIIEAGIEEERRQQAAEEVRGQDARRQLDAARVGHQGAVRRLRNRMEDDLVRENRVTDGAYGVNDRRAEAVIALKASTEAAASEMRSQNARRAERHAESQRQRESEKVQILETGGNPYQVFRQRDEDARLALERKRMNATLESNMTVLQGRIIEQYKTEAKEREKTTAHREAVEAKAKSISSAGKEAANNKYMFEMTKRHVTVLDPTSKETSMHASENMTVTSRPDWKFGLGMGVDADVVDHYSAKYPDVTAKEAARAEAKAAAARAVAVPSGGARGKTQLPQPSAASVRLMAMEAAARHEAVDELLEADAEGLWEDDVEGVEATKAKAKANPYGLRELSVLEKKYLSDAAGRQKANQIVKQVVGGKEWKGPPFLCKPAELLFADFEVGNTYELKFTMTNVSYSFNAFRPQDLPIAVASFF